MSAHLENLAGTEGGSGEADTQTGVHGPRAESSRPGQDTFSIPPEEAQENEGTLFSTFDLDVPPPSPYDAEAGE